ncbi:MAG: ribulose-phosphate 3-epimerase [Erysipelotrichaceae bacterium]
MSHVIVSPSILSLDYSRMSEQLDELVASEASWLHFDVMDNHFVPNLTFGPDLLKGIKKRTGLFMDVHIMVEHPLQVARMFQQAGADLITFHVEACEEASMVKTIIKELHATGVKAGLSIKPNTPVQRIEAFLADLDLVLVMSVEPGFGGQAFQPEMLAKIEWLQAYREQHNLNFHIEVDGGINAETAPKALQAGADVLVAGSYIFKNDLKATIHSLRTCKPSY